MSETPLEPMRFELKGKDARALRATIGFVSRDPKRSILQAICLDAGGWLVATDGSRLFRWRTEGLADLTAPVVLGPWPGVDLPGEDEPVTLTLGEDEARLSTPSAEVVVGVMEGPYVKYEEAVGEPGPVEAVMRGHELQESLEEIEPFLESRHPLAGLSGWDYRPIVQVIVSSLEQSVDMATTRDLGYHSPTEEGISGKVTGPQWEFNTRTKADVRGLADGEIRRFGVNAEYFRQVISALDLDDSEEVCMHLGDERPAIHFTVPAGSHRSAVVMPVRMA